jgi:VanZ family protein
MIRADKVAHFVVSLILTIVLAIVVKSIEGTAVSGVLCGIYAAIATMCVGVGKEIWDKFKGTGFDIYDLVADALGCLVAVAFSLFM